MEDRTRYAIIETGGKQFRVTAGQKILVDKLEGSKGSSVTIEAVLLVSEGEQAPRIGAPYVSGASVSGTILRTCRAKKVVAFKKRRKKGYKRKVGHRQEQTELLIDQISL